ncbi:MAG: hypothetical protein ABL982_15125 [Vicinamibacterales bacterium]
MSGPQRKYDTQRMFQDYLGMEDRSYAKVAKLYSVAKHTVVRIARDECWLERMKQIEAEAKKIADQRLVESRAEMHERHLKMIKVIQTRSLQGLQAHAFDNARDSARALSDGIKLERTVQGDPSDHRAVSITDVTRRELDSFVTGSLFPEIDDEPDGEDEG